MKLFKRDILKSGVKFKDLDTFLVVARNKNFLAAAKELGIAQSTVSMRIAAIEKNFGVRVFKRTLYGVTLTEEGAAVLKAVESIFSVLRDTQKAIATMGQPAQEQFSIASCHTCGLYIIPPLAKKFEERYGIKPSVSIADMNMALTKLRNKEVDFACIGPGGIIEQTEYVQKCERVEIGQDELVVVVPPNNELVGEKSVDIKNILTRPFLAPMRHTDLYREVERLLQQIGYSYSNLNVISELDSPETILMAVGKGIGISIVSSIPAREAEKEGRVKMLKLLGVNDLRNFYLLQNKGGSKKKATKTFWNFAVSEKKEVPHIPTGSL